MVSYYFQKVGALSIIFVWLVVIFPFFGLSIVFMAFPKERDEVIFTFLIIITIGLTCSANFLNK